MRPFSIYFPQFYPTPTNDKAWGVGFTDWSLVANANLHQRWLRRSPLRGYYDGASAEVHHSQLDEMMKFGLGGVAVYHYWFFSHQELPAFESTLLQKSNDFPWFLIWATEGWSKRWIGDATEIIHLKNTPSIDDIEVHCDHLAQCFMKNDYFKVNGRPVFVIYNISHFDNPEEVLRLYSKCLDRRGFNVFFIQFIKNPLDVNYSMFFDASYLFEPRLFFGMQRIGRGGFAKKIQRQLTSKLGDEAVAKLMLYLDRFQQKGARYCAEDFIAYMKSDARISIIKNTNTPVQDVISPGWNNTPRYNEKFTCLENIDHDIFANLVLNSSKKCEQLPPLINAWNEWSEGAAIEPCAYLGARYLEAIKNTQF